MAQRKKLDITGRLDDVIHMFNVEKMTSRDIAARLKSEHGIDISHVVIAKAVKQHNEQANQVREKAVIEIEKIKALSEMASEDSINYLDIAELLNNRLMLHLTNALDKMDEDENHFKDVKVLVNSIESISRNLTLIHKTKLSERNTLEEVEEKFRSALWGMLQGENPQLFYDMTAVLKRVKTEMEEESKK